MLFGQGRLLVQSLHFQFNITDIAHTFSTSRVYRQIFNDKVTPHPRYFALIFIFLGARELIIVPHGEGYPKGKVKESRRHKDSMNHNAQFR
jgi:hypothetical protein